jgi:calcineurin-like phosphoesterase family protein
MTTWIGSDYHLNHLNILKYCDHRVPDSHDGCAPHDWDDVAEMNEKIISNHNSLVAPDDEVYLLGDICMGQIIKAPDLIRRLNGRKYLIKGNHDKTLHKLIKNDENNSDLFIWVKDVIEMSYRYNEKKIPLFFSHFPHAAWPGMNQGVIHAHGHLHGSPSGVTGRIIDVGIDTNNLFPYKMDDVIERMLKIELIRNHH